jgi:ATP-dependent Zn protease
MTKHKRSAEELFATAIHEAGHAVIGRILDFRCGKTSIRMRGKTSGYSIIPDPLEATDDWEKRWGKYYRDLNVAYRARIMVQMAGRAAEEECLGECLGGDGDDQYRIAGMIVDLGLGLKRGEALQRRLRRMTAQLVRRHRQKIETLARALVEQPTMTDRQIREVAGLPRAPRRRSSGLSLNDPKLIAMAHAWAAREPK